MKLNYEYRLNIMPRFVIVCPKGVATGGPEALHQLASAIADLGQEAFLWDSDEVRGSSSAANSYEGYMPRWTDVSPRRGDIVVISEVSGNLLPFFYLECSVVFWWLSVDNFFGADSISIDVLIHSFPNLIHCYQSEYARNFLEGVGISEALPLSDYLNDDFVKTAALESARRPNTNSLLIAVNPAKGFKRASRVLDRMNTENIIRLENMSRGEVVNSLLRAEIYLDLGNHPGKDRIPREAALLNCVVVTNIRGSAGNQVDVPIEKDIFKFDDGASEFATGLILALKKMIASPESYRAMQNPYRAKIAESKGVFNKEVLQLIQVASEHQSTRNLNPGFYQNLPSENVAKLITKRDSATTKLLQMRNSLFPRITNPLRRLARLFGNFQDDN